MAVRPRCTRVEAEASRAGDAYMLGNWGHSTRRCARNALRREAVAAFCVFVLLLNTLAGFLSHSHYAAAGRVCAAGGRQQNGHLLRHADGFRRQGWQCHPWRTAEQQPDLECACCLLMQAHAVRCPRRHPPRNRFSLPPSRFCGQTARSTPMPRRFQRAVIAVHLPKPSAAGV